MNNLESESFQRYSDFSEQNELIREYYPGKTTDEWILTASGQIQGALSRKNPILGIQQLLAFDFYTRARQTQDIQKQLKKLNKLFVVNIVLVGVGFLLLVILGISS